ncbi:alpha/beta fold hydrolase [Chitinimonas sp.]|uniref:alpha/beta hydrolase family protein n=1 Tax=Chitinimonas sp. TaxID=1934313 RepID=UPI002F95FF49
MRTTTHSPILPAPAPVPAWQATPIALPAADGYPLRGFAWRHPLPDAKRPLVIINAATSVRCRYYNRFADWLYRHGFDVLIYDYRGIGESRQGSLRGFTASWADWGALDFEGVLQYAATQFQGQPVHVVGHSIGGFVIGLAPSNHLIARIFTMGAQYACWHDYAQAHRWRMYLKWHVFMPLLTALYGYFPGKRLGWLEDTPRGVVWDWTRRNKRPGRPWLRISNSAPGAPNPLRQFDAVTAPILAVGISDDEFGTVAAIDRLLARFRSSAGTHLRIAPAAVGEAQIGHFAFFHSRFERSLWPLALHWLQSGEVRDVVHPGH